MSDALPPYDDFLPTSGRWTTAIAIKFAQDYGQACYDAAIHAAEAERDALRRDAERYRWLRSRPLDAEDTIYIAVADHDHIDRWGLGGDDPDGCDAAIDAALAPMGEKSGLSHDPSQTCSEWVMLDDEGRAMIADSHHYTAENISAIVADLKAVEAGNEAIKWADRDYRTQAGVLWRLIVGLGHDVPLSSAEHGTEGPKDDATARTGSGEHR